MFPFITMNLVVHVGSKLFEGSSSYSIEKAFWLWHIMISTIKRFAQVSEACTCYTVVTFTTNHVIIDGSYV